MVTRCVSLVLLVLMTGVPALAQQDPGNPSKGSGLMGHTFYVNDPRHRNSVTFRSEAPLEDIVGMSSDVSGKIMFDPTQPEQGATATLNVSASSFTTGIPMRDEHLASESWLDAAHFPQITLVITKVNNVKTIKKTPGAATFEATVTGDLTIRGKTNPVSFVARVTYLEESEETKKKMDGNLLAVRAEFPVTLGSFGIEGPPGMGLIGSKVGEEIDISVSLFGTTVAPDSADKPKGAKKG